MSGDLPLNGCDYLMLGFDYELRRTGYAGNSCQIVLELGSAISPEALRQRLAELVNRYPILRARPGGIFLPKWKSAGRSGGCAASPRSPRPTRPARATQRRTARHPNRGELFRFDLVERDGGRMDVVFTWAHALMDANSAEHFLAVVGREDVPLPATQSPPPRPKKPLKERFQLAWKNINQLTEFCKAAPRSVGGAPTDGAGPSRRYRVEKFSAEETARIRANGVRLCGALGDAQFHAAVAMVELHRLHQRLGCRQPELRAARPGRVAAQGQRRAALQQPDRPC